jgi:hypothetical protein
MHGQGTVIFGCEKTKIKVALSDQESWYEGSWAQGQKDGDGTLRYPSGGLYVGRFENDTQHGHGAKSWSNGDSYVGEWVNGRITGLGRFRYSDGAVFEGKNGSDGKLIGGSLNFGNGIKYEGDFGDNSVDKWINEHHITEESRDALRSNARLVFVLRAQRIHSLI